MIEFTKGDMFDISVDARVNTVNCVGVMGTGVALAFKKRYPEMFKDYENACREGRVRPGALHVWKSLTGDWVINFPTKRDWRDPSRYEDISSGLDALRIYLREQGPISVALPALGCGHGGLEWDKVSGMIENGLGDLKARVLVFEPQDSRNAGHAVQVQSTEEQIHALEDLGFKPSHLLKEQEGEAPSPTVLSKGDSDLLARHWIALLPSKDPAEREMTALNAVAHQMASSANSVPVALVHTTRSTERVAELFLTQGVPVVLILPFGPLSRKSVARTQTDNQRAPFAIVSIAAPSEPWGRPILGESMRLLKEKACSILLSDPDPSWLNKRSMRNWAERPTFYLRYDNLPDVALQVLEDAGARPIGRRLGTGEPNLAALFGSPSSWKRNSEENRVGIQHSVRRVTNRPRIATEARLTPLGEMTVQGEIDSASEFQRGVKKAVLARRHCPAGDRDVLLVGYWSLILDYHKGILSLLTHGCPGSAFALVWPVVEALIRSHIVLIGSDDDLCKIRDDTYVVNFKTVGAQIDAAFRLDGFFENFVKGARDALPSFTRSGASQLGRRFKGTNLTPTYSDEEIRQVIRMTTTAVFMVTNLLTKHFKFEPEAKAAGELFKDWGNIPTANDGKQLG